MNTLQMDVSLKSRINKSLILILLALVVCICVHVAYVINFNSQTHIATGTEETDGTTMDIHARGDDTSSWVKQDLDIYGIIYDGTITNNSPDLLSEWTLTINITHDCWINQFWNGTVEIHQNVGTDDEVVETVNLANYDTDTMKLEYMMDGSDLLIPLHKGDYVVYFPSDSMKEYPIEAGEELVVGTIFYYAENLDLTNYTMEFKYHRSFTQGIGFIICVILAILWIFILTQTQSYWRKCLALFTGGRY